MSFYHEGKQIYSCKKIVLLHSNQPTFTTIIAKHRMKPSQQVPLASWCYEPGAVTLAGASSNQTTWYFIHANLSGRHNQAVRCHYTEIVKLANKMNSANNNANLSCQLAKLAHTPEMVTHFHSCIAVHFEGTLEMKVCVHT